ncbi:MAG: carbonic anhydrase [Bacteroidetes bacterium MED-G17]|nr:MAG: carbonic anhydrase [Bacteroidetes bacterium TMED39]PDH53512.1 MAG: carbonic anhydrase [Bacteroidetes bacterium MED-G17]CAI8285070.1 MAG: Carbonic anhydrase [Bacteroidetes bacterium MED-G17]|tara:strand:- start:2444 stop:3007 length:564 start_codon:yes stop_codon:yes gene_type:complete
MTQTEILNRLKNGNLKFVEDKLKGGNNDQSRRNALTSGQSPFAIVLSCADSRVVPEMLFDTGLGELFVIRVAGNIANASSIASIEYAVAHLKTSLIVVLGHESCGAVKAAISGGDLGKNLNHLVSYINPAVKSGLAEKETIHSNARLNAERLLSDSEIIKSAADEGKVKIVSAYYNLSSGVVDFLNA